VTALVGRTTQSAILLDFAIAGPVEQVLWPPPAAAQRQDDLWRSTCLEAFFQAPKTAGYWELNFSPSHAWAAYAFDGYRTGMRAAPMSQPTVDAKTAPNGLFLRALLPVQALAPFAGVAPTAVIETRDGEKSYWAPAHAKDTPDFHTLAGMAPLPDATEPA
jgi:hypothetical protein